jgi:RNA polymerase sigma-70 factor (ECF subfamily)
MASELDSNPPDEILVARIAGGDVDALGQLFHRRQRHVYRFVLHLTGSASLADDVTQDVFVTVIREAGRFEAGRAPVPAWLCGIARNFVRRRLAVEQGAAPVDSYEEMEVTLHASTPDPLDALTTAESIEALRRAVLSLPLRYREALVLCDLQEMSYVDAAAALNCPVGTVRSRLSRARALLTEKMLAEQQRKAEPVRGIEGVTKCLA